MSSAMLLLTAGCIFVIAYRYYAAFLAAKVVMLDDRNITPSITCNDGHDYVPTNKWVVFGHHFAAIAGAGPLIGPVLAAQYGWGPGAFWIILGSVFAGCVHDFIILFASIRHKGDSLAVIARKEVGPTTGTCTAIAILFIIIAALAGLAIAVVNALYKNAWGTFTIAATIPIAMIIGLYMFRIKPGSLKSGSIVGFLLVCAAVFFGRDVADSSIASWFMFDRPALSIMLPAYGFLAATLPVWLLLAPRDYLSSYMKIGVIFALAVGVLIVNPIIRMDFVTPYIAGGGPIIPGPVWPFVFITIACGAISGFHSLIGSGTTPKMIEKETEAKFIGYGAMLMEAFVGMTALIAATTLIPADYFAINAPANIFAKLNMKVVDLPELSMLVGIDVAARPGGAVSLAVGMAHIFSSIGGLKHMMNYWYQFIIMFEALFILTTIDAGTRVSRYILQDILGYFWEPIKNKSWTPGMLLTSALVSVSWGYLLYTGDIGTIWPMFGCANQLLATLALAIGTTLILKITDHKAYALTTFIPTIFIGLTTIWAGILNTQAYLQGNKMLLACMSIIIIILAIIIVLDNARLQLKLLQNKNPIGLNDGREKTYCPKNN